MFDFFQISGNIQLLNMIESGPTIAESHIFNILIELLSWPWALLTFNDLNLIKLIINSLFSNLIEESLVFAM